MIKLQKPNFKKFSFGRNPESDWKVIFTVASLVALIGIAVNIFIYLKIDKGEIFVVEGPVLGQGHALNIEELRATVEYYENKAENFERIIRSATSTNLVDPSL